MKKRIGAVLLLLILLLGACGKSDSGMKGKANSTQKNSKMRAQLANKEEKENRNKELDTFEEKEEKRKKKKVGEQISFENQEDVEEYLVGKWSCHMDYQSDLTVDMVIDDDLKIVLSFYSPIEKETVARYTGKISFTRFYRKKEEAPDALTIELKDEKYPEADFFYLHKTIYGGKRVMALFPASREETVFDILTEGISELIFEKDTGEKVPSVLRKNEEFYAVFWGTGGKNDSMWLDDVVPTEEEGDFARVYPFEMTLYDNASPNSTLYKVAANKRNDIFGEDLLRENVYYVRTNQSGEIVEFVLLEYKKFLEESKRQAEIEAKAKEKAEAEAKAKAKEKAEAEAKAKPKPKPPETPPAKTSVQADEVVDIISMNATVQGYLNAGMTILFGGETGTVNGKSCYMVYLGTNHEESFVTEVHCAVDRSSRQVYMYDILSDSWMSI